MQEFTADIRWACPECEQDNDQTVGVPELNYMAEKTRDMAVDDEIELECGHCGIVFTGWVYVDAGSTFFQMEDPTPFEFHGDMPHYGPDIDEYIPDDPHSIALEALGTLGAMVGQIPAPQGDGQFPNRLIFAGAITALEAYLSDTLLGAIRDNEKIFKEIATKNEQLKIIRLPMEQLVSQSDLVKTTVLRHLSGVMYHNLPVVSALYKDAFGVTILPDKDRRDKIYQAILFRHDCVHRNGSNKDGEKLDVFTDQYVSGTLDEVRAVIQFIEQETAKVLYPADGSF